MAAYYWQSNLNLVLRYLAAAFSLVAFSLIAEPKNEDDTSAFTASDDLVYALAVNVITCVYSLGHIAFCIALKLSRSMKFSRAKSIGIRVAFFVGDQILAYLLLSSGSSATTVVKLLNKAEAASTDDDYGVSSSLLAHYSGAVAMALLSFITVCISALLSAYDLRKAAAAAAASAAPARPPPPPPPPPSENAMSISISEDKPQAPPAGGQDIVTVK